MVGCMGWRKRAELQGLEEVIAWVDGTGRTTGVGRGYCMGWRNWQNYRGWKRLLHGLTELAELQGLEEVVAWVDGTGRTTGVGRGYCMGWRNWQNYRGWKRLLHGLTELAELQGLEEVILHQRCSLSYTAGRENNVTSWSHNFKQGYPWDLKKKKKMYILSWKVAYQGQRCHSVIVDASRFFENWVLSAGKV